MAPKKGMSVSEKCTRLVGFFHSTLSVYNLKDLEKLAGGKETGISPMHIKEILQLLIDDGLVNTERIGSGNFYWSFPGTAEFNRKKLIDQLKNDIECNEIELINLGEQIETEKNMRIDSAERESLLKKSEKLTERRDSLLGELDFNKKCDPEYYHFLCEKQKRVVDAVNIWTDNIFAVLSYFKQTGVDITAVRKEFEIPEDLDNV